MTAKSCVNCPSYEEDQTAIAAIFGKGPSAPVCVRYGHVLGRSGQDATALDAVRATFAEACDFYREPRIVLSDDKITGLLGRVLTWTAPDSGDHEPVSTCMNCENQIKSNVAHDEWGWTLPACKAHGALITSVRKAAKDCEWSVSGMPTDDVKDVDVLDIYKQRFRSANQAAAFTASSYDDLVGADEYPNTDKKVTKAETAVGIRAWRKVEDPAGKGKPLHLPVFAKETFSEEEYSMVPQTGDEEHPELYLDYNGLVYRFAIESVQLRETPALIGQPGLGKTEAARHIAWLMGLPFARLSMNARMDPDDVLGTVQFTEGVGTHFEPGVLPIRWERPGVLLIDEPNAAPEAVWQVLRPMADNAKQLVVEAAPGRPRFQRNQHCYPILAMNPAWDMRNSGIADLAMADANRLTPILVNDPPKEIEAEILRRWCALDGYDIDAETVCILVEIGAQIRERSTQGTFPDHWGLRQQIKVARKTRFYDLEEAFAMASLNFYDDMVRNEILMEIRTFVR